MNTITEYALQMQLQLAKQGWNQEGDPQGYIRSARWHYWHSKYSAIPTEHISTAKDLYRLARDMQADPAYYTSRPGGTSCWQWFQRKGGE